MASSVSDVLEDYFEWRLDFNIGIELEVAYDKKKEILFNLHTLTKQMTKVFIQK